VGAQSVCLIEPKNHNQALKKSLKLEFKNHNQALKKKLGFELSLEIYYTGYGGRGGEGEGIKIRYSS